MNFNKIRKAKQSGTRWQDANQCISWWCYGHQQPEYHVTTDKCYWANWKKSAPHAGSNY